MWLLQTEKGEVLAEHVVIAAGSYANQVGAWFGLKIPSVSCLHHYLVTDTVPEFEGRPELPVMRDNAFGGYIRLGTEIRPYRHLRGPCLPHRLDDARRRALDS